MSSQGWFVTLEGGEGVGKSSLASALAVSLLDKGLDVVRTREPGGTPGAEAIRALLVSGEASRWGALTEALLFSAARNDHLDRLIRPALARGALVLCDRYLDSTIAYQTASGGVSPADCGLLAQLIKAPQPDMTFLLDLPVEQALARSRGGLTGEERFEGLGLEYHGAVRRNFLEIAAWNPHRVRVLDASLEPETVLQHALEALNPLLERRL